MSTKVLNNFVEPLRRSFDDPFSDITKNNELFIRLDGALDHFSQDTLQQAVIRLQNVWQSRKFPTQAACVAACVDVNEKKDKQRTQYPVIRVGSNEWDAWLAHYRAIAPSKARMMESSTRGIWTVPSLWPPGYRAAHTDLQREAVYE